jgi:hypothetical protein
MTLSTNLTSKAPTAAPTAAAAAAALATTVSTADLPSTKETPQSMRDGLTQYPNYMRGEAVKATTAILNSIKANGGKQTATQKEQLKQLKGVVDTVNGILNKVKPPPAPHSAESLEALIKRAGGVSNLSAVDKKSIVGFAERAIDLIIQGLPDDATAKELMDAQAKIARLSAIIEAVTGAAKKQSDGVEATARKN